MDRIDSLASARRAHGEQHTPGSRRMRRLTPWLVAIGVIAGLVPATAQVAQADRQPPSGQNSQANPDFAASCGTDVVMVLDESGSIKDTSGAESAVVSAVKAFVTGLNGTGSRIRLVEFGTNARDVKLKSSTAFQTVDPSLVTAVNSYLDDPVTGSPTPGLDERYNPLLTNDYYTNWEAGLNEALAPQVDSKNGAPLVVFITDGVPNTVGTNGNATGGNSGGVDGNQAAADAAIDEMALLQARPGHVLGVGVGTAVTGNTFDRLANLVEPKTTGTNARSVWTNSNDALDIRTTDLLKVSNFANLPDAISRVVYALCSPSLTLTKVDQSGATVSGLDFKATVDVKSSGNTSGAFQWVKPGSETQTGATTKTVTTGANGSALFQWTPGSVANPQPWDSVATFSETLQPGWTLDPATTLTTTSGAACTVNRYGVANPIKVALNKVSPAATPMPGDTVTFSLVTAGSPNDPFRIQKADIATCTVKNIRPGTITVAKTTTPAATAGNFAFTTNFTTTAPDKILSHGESFTSVPLVPGAYTIAEAAQTGWDLQSVSCGTATNGSVTVNLAAGQNLTCTFVNKLVPPPQIDVTKTASPTTFQETSGTVTYTVTVANPGTEPLTLSALTDSVTLNGGQPTVLDLASGTPGSAAGANITNNTCNSKINVSIAAGGNLQCSFTAPYTGRNSGDAIADVVTATGKDKFNRTVIDTANASVAVTNRPPVITVDKQNVEPITLVAPGGPATYSVKITNGPNAIENITITSVADQLKKGGANFGSPLDITHVGGGVTSTTCQTLIGTVLTPGQSVLCQFTVSTTALGSLAQSDLLRNDISVTAEDDEKTPVTGVDFAERTVLGAAPQIAVFKSDGGAVITEPGSQITYNIDIRNLGTTEAVTITTITDEVAFNGAAKGTLTVTGSPATVATTLPAGVFVSTTCGDKIGSVLAKADALDNGVPTNSSATTSCSITLNLAANASDQYADKVTVSGVDETGDPVTADNGADTPAVGVDPHVTITKTPNTTSVPETGGAVTFTFAITNTSVSSDPLTLTALTDTVFGDLFVAGPASNCAVLKNTVLLPGTSTACTLTTTLSGTVATPHSNTVTVIGIDDEGVTATDDDRATVAFDDVAPTIDVSKSADPTHVSEFGGVVTYTVDVHNTSSEPVTLTSLTDDRFGNVGDPANTTVTSTNCELGIGISAGGTYSCTFQVFVAQANAAAAHVNVVTAVATDDDGSHATDTDDAEVTFDLVAPTVTITKTDNGASVAEPGGPVTYHLTITNTSAEHVTVTSLTDTITYEKPSGPNPIEVDLLGPVAPPVTANDCAAQLAGGLDAGAAASCSFTVVLTGTAQDTDDVVAVDVVDDDQQTGDDQAEEFTPITDVVPQVQIVKSATPTTIEPGQDVTFTFVISNLSTFEAITLNSLADDKFGDLTTECFGGVGPVLAPNDGVDGSGPDEFTCSVLRSPAGDGVVVTTHENVATVTAADDEGNEVTDVDDAIVTIHKKASISVKKIASPSGGTFDFTVAHGGNITSRPVVAGDVTPVTWSNLDAGSYNLSEALPTGWLNQTIACEDANGAAVDTTPIVAGAQIDLAWGDAILCTFSNVQLGDVTVSKSITQAPVNVAGTNLYDVTYQITVTSESYRDESFDLADTLGLAAGVTVDSIGTISKPAGVELNGNWNGVTDVQLTDGQQTIAGRTDSGPTTVVITIPVRLAVAADATGSARECDTAGEQGGALNSVDLASTTITPDDSVCADLPDPSIDISKSVASAQRAASGVWTIVYDITVTNNGAGPGSYVVNDALTFGGDVTVVNATASAVAQGLAVNADFDGQNDTLLASGSIVAGATHAYLVTTTATVAPSGVTGAGDCVTIEGEDGTGFLNTAEVRVGGVVTDRADACAPYSTLTLVKTVVNDNGGNAGAGDFALTARGPADLSVASGTTTAVPAGEYVLGETGPDGYSSEGYTCVTADQSPVVVDAGAVTVGKATGVTCTVVNNDVPVDLELVKSDNDAIAIAGGAAFQYDITVTNNGRSVDAAEPVVVTDELPAEFRWVTLPAGSDLAGPCAQNGQTLTCEIKPESLGAGASVVLTATAKAVATTPAGVFTNQAWVTTADDPVCDDGQDETCVPPPCGQTTEQARLIGSNNVDCEDTPVDRDATITVTKTDSVPDAELVRNGQQFDYTLTVTNNGPSPVSGVRLTDDLPAGLQLVSVAGGTGWSCSAVDPVVCGYSPSLAAGETSTAVTVTVLITPSFVGDTINNTAIATAVVDTLGGPKTVTDDDIEITPLVRSLDVTAFSPECVNDAPYISYDIVPLGFVPVNGNATLTFFDKNGNQVGEPAHVTSLKGRIVYPGATVVDGVATDWPGWKFENGLWVQDPSDAILRDGLTIKVQVNPEAIATVTYPSATSACADPKQPSADLAIVKSTTDPAPAQGTSFSWVLDITNNGPDAAVNVVVSDGVPAPLQVTAVSSSLFACSAVGNVVTCKLALLAAGAAGSVVVTALVPPTAAAGPITNVANVTATTPDPNQNNNSDDATVTIPDAASLPPVIPAPPSGLPTTGTDVMVTFAAAAALFLAGWMLLVIRRRRGNV